MNWEAANLSILVLCLGSHYIFQERCNKQRYVHRRTIQHRNRNDVEFKIPPFSPPISILLLVVALVAEML